MAIYTLQQTQDFKIEKSVLWDFISKPQNLNEITPDDMNFHIVGDIPTEMYPGLLIQYRLNLPLLGKGSWLTEITEVEEGERFIDEQRIGPYALWHHEHRLEEIEGGVRMHDKITYSPPFGILGQLAHSLYIGRKLKSIFKHRKEILAKRFHRNVDPTASLAVA